MRKHIVHSHGYRTEWWMGPRGSNEVHVNVYWADHSELATPVLEWVFPKIPGNNILGNACIFLEQAIIYAKNPPK